MLKITRKWILMLIFLTGIIHISFAQVEKFGKFESQEILKMKVYPKDSSAEAVVLFDVGNIYFKINTTSGGFDFVFERHKRIKVFNKEAYDLANVELEYYDGGSQSEEVISGLKGYSYNLVNGKIEKEKLENSAIFTEKVSEKLRKKKFTLPNVKEGTVIEYTYTITSPFIVNLRDWYFQSSIPILWSELNTSIPEYFNYRKNMSGYLVPTQNKESSETRSEFIQGEQLQFGTNTQKIVVQNAPPFKNEKFITTPIDYLSKIEFQLAYVSFPRRPVVNHLATWEEINKKLLEDEDFGGRLKARGDLKDIANTIAALAKNPEEKMKAIYKFVRENIQWNGDYGRYATQTLKKVYEAKKGNVADINMLLIALLREADIPADPVLLSTRDHGRVNTIVPILSNFNYVIAIAKVGDRELLLDATQESMQPNVLPFNCLNGSGRIVSEKNPDWVNLMAAAGKQSQYISINLKTKADGKIGGELNVIYNDYPALYIRKKIHKDTEEKFIENEWKSDKINFKLNSHKIENLKDLSQPLRLILDIDLDNEAGADMIYFNPLLVKHFDENPLKAEDRKFPVDFGCPLIESFVFSMDIPQGYQIEDMPKNLSMSTPDKSATFSYAIGQTGDKIQLRTRLVINRPIYEVDEYQTIRTFFTQLIAKQEEQIVLKKKSN
jgi:transglutaminase-like putative cysteine protease